jgi:hypothetical protein
MQDYLNKIKPLKERLDGMKFKEVAKKDSIPS